MITHVVPSDVFDALAGGDGDMDGVLRTGQRSKRLLSLRQLISTLRSQSPPVVAEAGVDRAVAQLVDLERRARPRVDEVLLQPGVGAWAAACLRSLLRRGEAHPGDVGHLGAVVAAAALRAGEAFDVTTFVRDGTVTLPTYGQVRLEGALGWCRMRSRPGVLGAEIAVGGARHTVPFDDRADAPTWRPLRRLRAASGGVVLEVHLDDVDPFRGCDQLAVAPRLEAAAVDDWQAKLDEAWALLVEDHRPTAEAIATGVVSVVPLLPSTADAELSATCHEAIGAVAMTQPRTSLALTLALVHEFQHTKLSALLDLVPLVEGSHGAAFHAPWRSDPRPVRGLLQGTYAFHGLTRFWATHRRRLGPGADAEWAHFEFALGRLQVDEALTSLSGSGQLNAEGRRFVHGLRGRLSELAEQPVPHASGRLARLAHADHRTGWRLRNLVPDPERVEAWARAWLAGRARPENEPLSPDAVDGGGPAPSQFRLALLRRRLAFPTRWRIEAEADGATPGDLALVDGDPAQARAAYRARLAEQPDDLPSWAGLTLVHQQGRGRPTPAGWALTSVPEVVHAVHRAVRARCGAAPDPEDLAAWIAAGAADQSGMGSMSRVMRFPAIASSASG